MEKKVLNQLDKIKGLMVYEMGVPINEQKSYPKKQLLKEQLLKFFFKELLGSGDDVIGKYVKLNDGSVLKITDYNDVTLTFQGQRFDGDTYNFWKNTKGLDGEDLGTKMKVLDGGSTQVKTVKDFVNPRIFDQIKKNVNKLKDGESLIDYLKGNASDAGSFLNDLESLYIDVASKMTDISRSEVKTLVQNMDDAGHLTAIADVIAATKTSNVESFGKNMRAALKKQDQGLKNASKEELDNIIKFNLRQIEEFSPQLSKKIKQYFQDVPMEKLFTQSDELIDPTKIVKNLTSTTDLFQDLGTFEKFIKEGGPGAEVFVNALKHTERGGIDKIIKMFKNDILKTIQQFPAPFSVTNTLFGQYLKRLDTKWLWDKGYKTLSDLRELPGTKNYLKAKYGDDVLEETVAGSDNLKILHPDYEDFRAARLKENPTWNERESGWKYFFKGPKNGSQNTYVFGLWKQGVKKQFRNDIKRLGISAEMLQSFRGLVNILFIAGLVLEPGWTLTMFYNWLDTVLPFTDGLEKAKEQMATAAALSNGGCRKSGIQHWIDFGDNENSDLTSVDQIFEPAFVDERTDAQDWLFGRGWKTISPCIKKYRKEMSKLDQLNTHDLIGAIMQVSAAMKFLSQAGKLTSGGWIDAKAYTEAPDMPSPDEILDKWNAEMIKEKTQ
jgi:hypothetical protein